MTLKTILTFLLCTLLIPYSFGFSASGKLLAVSQLHSYFQFLRLIDCRYWVIDSLQFAQFETNRELPDGSLELHGHPSASRALENQILTELAWTDISICIANVVLSDVLLQSPTHCGIGSENFLAGLLVNCTQTQVFQFLTTASYFTNHLLDLCNPLTHCGIGSVVLAGLSVDCLFGATDCRTEIDCSHYFQSPLTPGLAEADFVASRTLCRVGSWQLTGLSVNPTDYIGVGSQSDSPIQCSDFVRDSYLHHLVAANIQSLQPGCLRSTTLCRVGSCALAGLSVDLPGVADFSQIFVAQFIWTHLLHWGWAPFLWLAWNAGLLIQTGTQISILAFILHLAWFLTILRIAVFGTVFEALTLLFIEGFLLLLAKVALKYCLYNSGHRIYSFLQQGSFTDNWNSSSHLQGRGKPGPKSRPGVASLIWTIGVVLFVLLLMYRDEMQYQWGEGSDPAMGVMEVQHDFPPNHWIGTKLHGGQPQVCVSTSARPETARKGRNQVVKRSLNRAYRRSQYSGFAWYRGRQYSISDFAAMGCKQTVASHPQTSLTKNLQTDWHKCNAQHSSKKRFSVWQWNCGGISSSRLDEVKAWLVMNHIDLAVLVETRMTFESTWTDPHWHILHSGDGEHRGKGIMLLVSKRLCSAGDLSWQVHDSGRLVHLRLNIGTRPLDLVACYQHVFQPTQRCTAMREKWWNCLEHVLMGIPNRNGLVLLGDFNCSVSASPSITGTSTFAWRQSLCKGFQHPDQGRFLQILRRFALVVLNSWSHQLGPTYVHGDQANRIDHICVRQMFADGEARRVHYVWDSPFMAQKQVGHTPILCTIAKYWVPTFAHGTIQHITMQQRQNGRLAFQTQSHTWQQFAQATQSQLSNALTSGQLDADLMMDTMHKQVLQTFCDYFPSTPTQRMDPPWVRALPLILNKWEHRRRMLRPGTGDLHDIFLKWFHVIQFQKLKRFHKKQARVIRQQQFREIVTTAASAAATHDTHKLFNLINRFAPKQPKKQIQLRNTAGHLASPVESAAIMYKFVADTWAGPSCLGLTFDQAPGVPFTVHQLQKALSMIPISRAVAKPFAPGIVWRQHASFLAPLLHDQLSFWWSHNPPIIPCSWKNGWLFMIPKPSRPPVRPEHLRPLALQEPMGKAVIGLLIHLAMKDAQPQVVPFPVWAYVEHRSTLDAIRRVCIHCDLVRELICQQRSTPHSRAARTPRHALYGGLQICLDLRRAFDLVDRRKLFAKLHLLNIQGSIIQLLTTWHEECYYMVQHGVSDQQIPVGRGVRQGCKAAPGLWTFFTILFLHELLVYVPLTWIQAHLTLYADDFHIGASFTSLVEFEHFHKTLGILFSTLLSMDMQLNPGKSVAILELRGSLSGALKRRLIHQHDLGAALKIEVPGHADVFIPVQRSTKYLGVIISYDNYEDASLTHRLQLMKVGYKRLQRWLTGRHSLTVAQRFSIWRTCIFPIFSYGLFATGLTKQGILKAKTQMIIMMRQICHDHSYQTRRNNQQALHLHRIPTPESLLHGTAESLLRSLQTRQARLLSTDLALTIHWNHLPDLIQLLIALQASAAPVTPTQSTLEACVQQPFFQCSSCDFCTFDVSAFRRHCTVQHGHAMLRTRFVQPADYTVDGLPTCRFCTCTFSTWRAFHVHIERGCQVVLSGPSFLTADLGAQSSQIATLQPMASQWAAAAARGLRLITAEELHNLRQQPFGPRLLQLVQDREWDRLPQDHEACQYLASKCIICRFQFTRCQELHQHFRLQHPELWEFAPQKAIQLTNLYSDEAPCNCCGALFRTHQCPTWSQISVLLVNGAGQDNMEAETTTEVRQRCEICLEWYPNTAELVQHLQVTHNLQGLSFNASRDSIDNSPACSHCGHLFLTVAGLKSHIVQGRCGYFNPQASAESLPVHESWRMACLDGKFVEILRPPMHRMRLTVTCQACGKNCRRAADLALHLQSSHARLWRQARRLTMVLVSAFAQDHCYCNPMVGTKRGNHVCLPLRQLAMAFHRLGVEPLAPTVITDELLKAVLSSKLPHALRYKLEQKLVHREFVALWQDSELLQLMRSQCLFCGDLHPPADMALHLREEHPCQHEMFLFYMEQLMPTVHSRNPDGFRCVLCDLIFNLPAHLQPEEPLAERVGLVISHLKGSCPCLIQISLLLASLLRGGPLQHGPCGTGSISPGDGSLQQSGTPVPGSNTEAGTQSQADQGTSTRRAKRQRTSGRRSGDGGGRCSANSEAAEGASATGGQTRPGDPKHAPHGSIHSFFESRSTRRSSPPHARGGTVEAEDGRCVEISDDATETAPHDHLGQRAALSSWQDSGVQRQRSALPHLGSEGSDLTRQELPISPMGPAPETAGDRQEDTHQLSENETTSRRASGHADRSRADCEIPCHEATEHSAGPSGALEATDQCSQRQALRTALPVSLQCHLDDSGRHDEAPLSGTDPPGNDGSVHDPFTQGQGKGQVQREGCKKGELTLALAELMITQMCRMQLTNDRNWCYANSAVSSLFWTLLCLHQPMAAHWGTHRDDLLSFLQQIADSPAALKETGWFQQAMGDWGASQGQKDGAECAQRLLLWMHSTACDMRWERRLATAQGVQVFDHSMACTPITLTFTMQMHTRGHAQLSDMFATWAQEHSMVTALLEASMCLCIGIDRFVRDEAGEAVRSMCAVDMDAEVIIPVFLDSHLQCDKLGYIPVAGMMHSGMDLAGHYRAVMKLQPGLIAATQPANWMISDDGQLPTPIWQISPEMRRLLTVIWLVRTDCVKLPVYHTPYTAHAQNVAITQAGNDEFLHLLRAQPDVLTHDAEAG